MRKLQLIIVLIYTCLIVSRITGQTFTSTPESTITDFSCTEFNISVTGVGTVMNSSFGLEEICIDISHTYVSDLTIWLRSPQGTEVLLSEKNGGDGDHYTMTCFDGVSGTSIASGSPPFTGSFLAEEHIGLFNGGTENPNGTWVLKICDAFTGDEGTLHNFSLKFSNSPATVPMATNDDCATAIVVDVNADYSCTLKTSVSLSAATNSNVVSSCAFPANTFDDDVWFSFVATSAYHEVNITNVQGSAADLVFEVFSGDCNALTSILCHDDPDANFNISNLTEGMTYLLRIASKSNGLNTSFDLCVKEANPPPPSNDECANATLVTIANGVCSPVSGTVAGASSSGVASPCPNALVGNFNDDVWFSFVASQSIHEFDVTNVEGSSTALDYQILQGSCGGSEFYCYTTSGSSHNFFVNGLSVGTSYYLRIASFKTAPQNTDFDLCIKVPGASSNPLDDCAQAGVIPISVGTTCTATISGTLLDARPSTISEACAATIAPYNDDIWFTFQATNSSYDLDILNISAGSDLIFELLTGTSCASLTSVLCHDDPDETIVLTGLTMGAQYYLRIASYELTPQSSTFEVCLKSNTPPPSNDECAGAMAITPVIGSSCTMTESGSLLAATASAPTTSCTFNSSGSFDDDIWFTFDALETSHQITTSNFTGSDEDLVYEIYGGSCGALVPIRCHDDPNDMLIVNNLTIGSTYIVRVASYASDGQTTAFDICVHSPPSPPANDNCPDTTKIVVIDTSCNKVALSLVGATPSNQPETCQNQPFHNDIWVSFEAHQSKEVIELSNIVNRPEEIIGQLSSGTCASLTELECFSIPLAESNTTFTATNLIPGSTYFLRLASYDYDALNTTFDICIHDTIPDPPSNDECVSAVSIIPTSTQSCTMSVSGELLGATASNTSDCSGSGGFDDDVWYHFTATEVSHVVALENIAGSTQDLDVQVLSGTLRKF